MRPQRIEICAFGPFSGREEVDFSEIAGQHLLLIHGPTGAGKTTLLDAMCFALFGDTSGAERDGKQMRCDNAEPGFRTEVTYDFSLGERSFRVWRQPEQERPTKRGRGTTTESHKATLWERTACVASGEGSEREGKVLQSGASKVTRQVTQLFGFESEQFRQVVLLPQGQFRKLLTAESKDKEKILEQLFQTSVYGKLEKALSTQANGLKRGFEDEQVRMSEILRQAGAESPEELDTLRQAAESRLATVSSAVPLAQGASERATHQWRESQQNEKRRGELTRAHAERKVLSERAAEVDTLRLEHKAARRAEPVAQQQAVALRDAKRGQVAAGEVLVAEEQARADVEREKQTGQVQKQQAAREGERQAASERLTHLRAMNKGVSQLAEAQRSVVEAQSRETECQNDILAKDKALALALEGVKTQAAKVSEVAERAAQLEAVQWLKKNAEEAHSRRAQLEKLFTAVERQRGDVVAADKLALCGERDLEAMVSEQAKLEKQWREGQAGALARELSAGQACPVCGSAEHPQPARSSQALPSVESMEAAKTGTDAARAQLEEQRRRQAEVNAACRVAESEHDNLLAALGERADKPLNELFVEVERASVELSRTQAAVSELPRSKARLEQREQDSSSLKLALEAKRKSLSERQVARGQAEGEVLKLGRDVPEEFRIPGALLAAGKKARADSDLLEAEWKRAQSEHSESTRRAAASQARTTQCRKSAAEAAEIAGTSQKQFEEGCLAAGFDDPLEFEKALQSVARLSELEKEIRVFENAMGAADERIRLAKSAAQDLPPPSEVDHEALAKQATETLEAALTARANASKDCEQLHVVRKNYDTVRKKVGGLEAEWQLVESVAGLASGKEAPKISFQRFVLGALLDEVLLAATERLARMSKGRYSLSRQRIASHRGRAGGLDLDVMDTYTGASRAVATLSGGESFLAALSLSLGLADVVQSYAGGIRLDTLFIDEGFGTLDGDALDLALDTLTHLNAEGRLVGIISHVQELRNRIGTRLEIRPGEQGSRTQFTLA